LLDVGCVVKMMIELDKPPLSPSSPPGEKRGKKGKKERGSSWSFGPWEPFYPSTTLHMAFCLCWGINWRSYVLQ
jgi:hypothetical protein